MREALRCVRAQLGSLWPLLRHVCARLSRCPYIIRPYSRASRDVSGLPGPGRSFFFFLLSSSSESAHPRSVEPFLRASPLRAA